MIPRFFFFQSTAGVVASALLVGFALNAFAQSPFPQGPRGDFSKEKNNPFVRIVRHNDGGRTVTAKSEVSKKQEVKTYDKDNHLRLRRIYDLNRYGQPQTFRIYDGNGRPILHGEFIYDIQDRVREELLFDSSTKQMVRRMTHNYDGFSSEARVVTENLAPLPIELLYWMDPDTGEIPVLNTGEKKQGTPGNARTQNGSITRPVTPKKEKKGLFKKLFGK